LDPGVSDVDTGTQGGETSGVTRTCI